MNKIRTVLLSAFVALFFGACAFFSVGMLIPGASDAVEGDAHIPVLISEGEINDSFGEDAENWFSKSFAFRGKVVDAVSRVREKLIGVGNDQVVVGKDGFLFFEDTVDSFVGQNRMTEEELTAAAESLKRLEEYAHEHGAEFVFVCAPNKSTVYPEKMPDRYQKTEESDFDRLYAELYRLGVSCIDLRSRFDTESDESLIYHKRDTHWNGLGAYIAFDEISSFLGVTLPDFGEMTKTNDFEGDLDLLLYPGHTGYDEDTAFDLSDRFVYTSAYTNPMNMSISTRSGGEKKALIFRDSFGNALIPLAASTFEEVRFERANPYRIDLLENYDADCVIVIIAERNLRDLADCARRIAD